MDSFISLGLGADGMTAFVGLYLGESAAGGASYLTRPFSFNWWSH